MNANSSAERAFTQLRRLGFAIATLACIPASNACARPSTDAGPTFSSYDGKIPLTKYVRGEAALARTHNKYPIVYVGARWCPPCLAFKQAHRQGQLRALANVHFIEFDIDRSGDALAEAGYMEEFLPIFVTPKTDGRGSEQRTVGAEPGEQGLRQLVARLTALAPDHEARRFEVNN